MLSLGFGYVANLIDFIPSLLQGVVLNAMGHQRETTFNTCLNYFATWYSVVREEEKPWLC